MYIKLLNSTVDFSKNSVGYVEDTEEPDTPDTPDIPVEPDEPSGGIVVPEVMPETYSTFVSSYARNTMDDSQNNALYTFLYKLNESGIMSKIRQLYLPCVMPDWDRCFLNVARYFNENKEEYPTVEWVSNTTLGQCFEVCDYGIYRTSTEINWGNCITYNWADEDVTFDNWHILMFKPAQQDASTAVHSGGLNLRANSGVATYCNFQIGGGASATQRMRGQWASGTVKIGDTNININDGYFTFTEGWGNGTHDPYCVGISIKDSQLITPSSNYQEFAYNNRNLVNEINEMPLSGQNELPTTAMTGKYSWGGYMGTTISTQQSLATSVVSIGLGLTKDEIQAYMDYANEFMVGMGITNDNWNPDNLS